MSLFSSDDIQQEAAIKRHELEMGGVRGYLADIEVGKYVNALKSRNSRDRLIPTDLPEVPVYIEVDPAILYGLTEREAMIAEEIMEFGMSNVKSVTRRTANRVMFKVAARLIANGTVISRTDRHQDQEKSLEDQLESMK